MARAQTLPVQVGGDVDQQNGNAILVLSTLIAIALHGVILAVELPAASTRSAGGAVSFSVLLPVQKPTDTFSAQPYVPFEAPVAPELPLPIDPVIEQIMPEIEPLPGPPVEPVQAVEPAQTMEPAKTNFVPATEPADLTVAAAIVPEPTPPLEVKREPMVQPPPDPVSQILLEEAPTIEQPSSPSLPVTPPPQDRMPAELPLPKVVTETVALDVPRPMVKPPPPPRTAAVPDQVPLPSESQVVQQQIADLPPEEHLEQVDEPVSDMPATAAIETGSAETSVPVQQEDSNSQGDAEIALITEPVFARPPVPPEYPPVSQRRYEEGTVVFRVLVSSIGKSEEVTVWKSSGFNRLDSAAEQAVWKWQFAPARKSGIPVRSWVEIPVNFYLN